LGIWENRKSFSRLEEQKVKEREGGREKNKKRAPKDNNPQSVVWKNRREMTF
jgi:hypothetical protein